MSTKTISTILTGVPLDLTHYLQVSDGPITIFDIEGEVNSTNGNNYYIQLHGASPQNGDVPLWSRLAVLSSAATGINGFSFVYRPGGIDTSNTLYSGQVISNLDGSNNLPVYVAISSTDATYTAVAATTNVSVNYDYTLIDPVSEHYIGDTTTGVDSLAVWVSPSPANRLIKLKVTNNGIVSVADSTGTVGGMLMLFAYNAVNTAVPLQQFFVANGVTVNLTFDQALVLMQNDGALNSSGITPQGTDRTGCYLFGSSTAQLLTKTTGTNWNIQAWYTV